MITKNGAADALSRSSGSRHLGGPTLSFVRSVASITVFVAGLLAAGNNTFAASAPAKTYAVSTSATPSNGGTVSGTGSYTSGANATLTAKPAAGYVFDHWTVNGSGAGTAATVTVKITGTTTAVASFAPAMFAVSASATPSAGGTVSGTGGYTSGANATLTAKPAAGYVFDHWTVNGSGAGTAATVTVKITGTTTAVASFAPAMFAVSASATPSAGGTVSGTGSYTSGANATLTAKPAAGYVFDHWTVNGSAAGTAATVTVKITGTTTAVASFAPAMFAVSASATPSAGGTVSGTGSYTSGANATLTAKPAAGYVFDHWTVNGSGAGTAATVTVKITGTTTAVASFAPAMFAVSASATPSAGGTVSGTGSYTSGANATLTAKPAAGYVFDHWTVNGSAAGTVATVTVKITGTTTAVASFAPATFAVSVSATPSAGGTVTGGGSYTSGASVTLTAKPATGYLVGGWTVNGASAGSAATAMVKVSSNTTAIVTFVPATFTLSAGVTPGAGGTVSGGGNYANGATTTLTAKPAAGYVVGGWTVNGISAGSAATITVKVTGNTTATVKFVAVTYSGGSFVRNGKRSYVQIARTSNTSADLYITASPSTITNSDIKYAHATTSHMSPADFASKWMCPVLDKVELVQTFVGCGAAIGTAACLIADPESLGSLTPFCVVGIEYTADRGLNDCVQGISSAIASALNAADIFDLASMHSSIQTKDYVGAWQSALDYACVDANSGSPH